MAEHFQHGVLFGLTATTQCLQVEPADAEGYGLANPAAAPPADLKHFVASGAGNTLSETFSSGATLPMLHSHCPPLAVFPFQSRSLQSSQVTGGHARPFVQMLTRTGLAWQRHPPTSVHIELRN
eukprot:4079592-Amphidinium_carterae.1